MNSTKHILQKIIVNNYSYAILRPFIYLAERIKASRKNYVDKQQLAGFKLKAENIFADGIVKHGPFTGMKRSGTGSGASSNYAKLLGSYEKELHPFLAQIIEIPFSQIINIGSDDGYYAIGLALKMPQAQVTAFDINKKARELTQLNARLNQVGNLAVAGKFSADELTKHVASSRTLFIVDCEGEERNIFTASQKSKLVLADLIIELHLSVHPELLEYFKNIFSDTHHVDVVDSIPDHVKVMNYQYPELANLNYLEKRFILEERDEYMQWIWLRSKLNA